MRFDQNVLLRNLLFIISFVILIPVYEREVSKYSRIYKQPPVIQIEIIEGIVEHVRNNPVYTCI